MTTKISKNLTVEQFSRISEAALAVVKERTAEFYGWKNAPTHKNGKFFQMQGWGDSAKNVEISADEALEIDKQKLNGAYGERFICSLGTIAALIRNGYAVRFVQFRKEAGVPFDAEEWTVTVIEGMPIFHIDPEDLRLADVEDTVEILDDNSAPDVCWKKTNKVGEFRALLMGSISPGLDLVKIAQEASEVK